MANAVNAGFESSDDSEVGDERENDKGGKKGIGKTVSSSSKVHNLFIIK